MRQAGFLFCSSKWRLLKIVAALRPHRHPPDCLRPQHFCPTIANSGLGQKCFVEIHSQPECLFKIALFVACCQKRLIKSRTLYRTSFDCGSHAARRPRERLVIERMDRSHLGLLRSKTGDLYAASGVDGIVLGLSRHAPSRRTTIPPSTTPCSENGRTAGCTAVRPSNS